jgi:hypothetical protein
MMSGVIGLPGGWVTPEVRATVLERWLNGADFDSVGSPDEFYRCFQAYEAKANAAAPDQPIIGIRFADKWYPARSGCRTYHGLAGYAGIIDTTVKLGEEEMDGWYLVRRGVFADPHTGAPITKTFDQVLEEIGLCRCTAELLGAYAEKRAKADRLSAANGQMLTATGTAIIPGTSGWMKTFPEVPFGTPERPVHVIAEMELDTEDNPYQDRSTVAPMVLPFVRCFDLVRRAYVYIDADHLEVRKFDKGVIDKLVLPPESLELLRSVFAGTADHLAADVIAGRHGGMVVLGCGAPGTGKTMTAEVLAETTERPLYAIGLADLGDDLSRFEESLNRIFIRARRWNAILLIDECDVFLAKRDEDLTRSAIVGLFLRMLDHFQGFMFLTSNRPEVLDEALLSRATLRLNYPDLDHGSKITIWRNLCEVAGFEIVGDESAVASLGHAGLDGRQIRNTVRLARQVHPSMRPIAAEELIRLARISTGASPQVLIG